MEKRRREGLGYMMQNFQRINKELLIYIILY